MVWDTGIIPSYSDSIGILAVEQYVLTDPSTLEIPISFAPNTPLVSYPTDNCAAEFNTGSAIIEPQVVFPNFLNHTSGQLIVQPYLNSSSIAQAAGKPFMMFETNTASCGGFPGVSDSFGAALWALDYALTMAYSNFTGALFHVGGNNAFYNPVSRQARLSVWSTFPENWLIILLAAIFLLSSPLPLQISRERSNGPSARSTTLRSLWLKF